MRANVYGGYGGEINVLQANLGRKMLRSGFWYYLIDVWSVVCGHIPGRRRAYIGRPTDQKEECSRSFEGQI